MRNFLVLIFAALILSACAISKSPAPIIYNHKNSALSSSNSNHDALAPIIDEEINKINSSDDSNYIIPEPNPTAETRKIVYHEVQPGESIEDIAIAYEQSVEEIGRLNDLFPPYEVEPYQSLKINVSSTFVAPKNFTKPKSTLQSTASLDSDFIPPVQGEIISHFGKKTIYGVNKGINIAAKAGDKVQASAGGKVIYSDYDSTFGNLVMVKVDNENLVMAYAHLEDLIVNKGAKVKQGDIVGYVGNTGKVRDSQLHFAIREGKKSVNPLKYVSY